MIATAAPAIPQATATASGTRSKRSLVMKPDRRADEEHGEDASPSEPGLEREGKREELAGQNEQQAPDAVRLRILEQDFELVLLGEERLLARHECDELDAADGRLEHGPAGDRQQQPLKCPQYRDQQHPDCRRHGRHGERLEDVRARLPCSSAGRSRAAGR